VNRGDARVTCTLDLGPLLIQCQVGGDPTRNDYDLHARQQANKQLVVIVGVFNEGVEHLQMGDNLPKTMPWLNHHDRK
jgi:hypothetical protein